MPTNRINGATSWYEDPPWWVWLAFALFVVCEIAGVIYVAWMMVSKLLGLVMLTLTGATVLILFVWGCSWQLVSHRHRTNGGPKE